MSDKETKDDNDCQACHGTGSVGGALSVKSGPFLLNPPPCRVCGGTGRKPKSKKDQKSGALVGGLFFLCSETQPTFFCRVLGRPTGLLAAASFALYCGAATTSSVTGTTPEKPSCLAAIGERSIIRPLLNGPRSLIRTMTVRRFFKLVTRTNVPKGSERCAAVSLAGENNSPLAVLPSFCE